MRRISALLQAGHFRAAQAQLETIAAENPDFVEAQRLLAGTRLALGDAAGAERLLRRALSLDPGWTPTLTTLGELLLGSGRFEEAEPLLRKAAAGTPPHPQAALALARYYNDHGRHVEALAVAAPFCGGRNTVSGLAAQHVAALVALGRREEAIAAYRAVAASAPDNLAAAQALALALQASNRHAEAERIARRALKRGQADPALHYTHARSLIATGEFERAEAALRACLRLEPQNVDAHNDLARLIWMRTGDGAQSTASLDEALRTFSNNDALRAAKAAVLQGAGEPRAAYECFVERIAHAPVPPALLVRAGLAALEFDPGIALDLARRALAVLPDDGPARKLLAAAALGVGEAGDALRACEALLDETPDDQYLIALRTTAWRMLGDARYARLCDYPNMVVPYRLEVPQPWRDMGSFLADLKVALGKLHALYRHPLLFQSLRHGTETTEDLTRNTEPAIRALFRAFDAPIRDYMARIGHGSDPLPRRNNGTYRFNGSWSVRLRTSGFHHNHVHPRGWISSACYIELPDCMADVATREGVLTFAEPGIVTRPPLPVEYEVRPAAGMLVLFPSYFWHGTVPFSGDRTRLTVAFDAVPGRES
jgi:tetratricopeptide (TPR) repeat protein